MHFVYKLLKKVPKGMVTTYKELAKASGLHPRTIGVLMRRNSYKSVPCHRVVYSNGFIGGYNKGVKKKIMLLKSEGVKIKNNKIVDFKKKLFTF